MNKKDQKYYTDLKITWTATTQEEALSFENGQLVPGAPTVSQYSAYYQGGIQYGNPTRTFELAGDGTQYKDYRATWTVFYPKVTQEAPVYTGGRWENPAKYLVGLPGFTNQHKCVNGVCNFNGVGRHLVGLVYV